MDILERLRPRWRRSDPEVRAAAVREMGTEDQARLESIARTDPDVHVRRIAIKKLDDPERLEALAIDETDEELRVFAVDRAREIRVVVAGSNAPVADCEAALARLTDERSLVAVTVAAVHESIRTAALARTSGARALRDVVRNAADPAIRRAALARIDDPAILRSIAVGDGPAEVAVLALERITDIDTLRAVADTRTASKRVRQRARELVAAHGGDRHAIGVKEGRVRQQELCLAVERLIGARDLVRAADEVHAAEQEWAQLARDVEPREDVARRFRAACEATLTDAGSVARRRAAAETVKGAIEEALATRAALCKRVETVDDASVPIAVEEASAAWRRLAPVPDAQDAALAQRFRLACEAATARHRRWTAREAVRAKLEAVVVEAETLAAAPGVPSDKTWRALEKRWAALVPSDASAPDVVALQLRLATAGEQVAGRRREHDARRDEAQRENLARLEALCARLQTLVSAEAFDAKAARRELPIVNAATADLGPLPSSEQRAAWVARMTQARDELQRRLREAEEADEWRRWANVAAQEEIIRRVEALLEANDVAEGVRLLARLQDDWAAVASAPKDKAQALWERFRTARNELRKRCDAYLAENLEKKRGLCAQVAELGESTAWNETADLIKRLQVEWKEIGPVPIRHERALWQEFRAPCDRFFTRRKEYFTRVDAERQSALGAKTALCEKAEALADSTDWEATTTVMKRLQADWKQTGPLPRAQGEELWQRFRRACDRFFDRRSRRDELEEEALLDKAAVICGELETLATTLDGESAPPVEETGKTLDDAWAAWLRLDVATLASAAPVAERLHQACRRIAAAQPDCLRGTRLDPATTRARREKLCVRLEKLVDTAVEAPPERSLQEMALALRERLASNTIGGGETSKGQDTAHEIERISASWAVLGPVLDDEGRALAERFERARAQGASRKD